MEHGGRRNGAGRKKGSMNKDRAAFVQALREAEDVDELIGKMRELARGVLVQEGGKRVYQRPPDAHAIAYLLDQAFGKAKQHVEVEGNGQSYEDLIIGIGQELAESKGTGNVGQAGN